MKRYQRCTAITVALLSCMFLLTSCFDRRELDTLGIVMGVALDKAQSEGDVALTVQIVNPVGAASEKSKSKSSKGGDSGGSSSAFINVSDIGKNINFIIREMQHKISRRIYVAHNQVIVFGEELAKDGVRDSLDFFARAPEARMTLYVFVAKGKASETLDIQPEFEKLPSVELTKILKDQKITAHTPIVTEFDFASKIVSKTTSAIAPIVRIQEDKDKNRLLIGGCAVFKQSKMVGELDEAETNGVLFVLGKVKNGVILAEVLNETATIEVREASVKVKPFLYTNGTVEFKVLVDMTIGLGDQAGTINLTDPDNVPVMLQTVEASVKNNIQRAVDHSKALDADVFGFGDCINRKYPEEWKKMESRWDELYKNIKVDITVKAKADGSGRIVMPLVPEGE